MGLGTTSEIETSTVKAVGCGGYNVTSEKVGLGTTDEVGGDRGDRIKTSGKDRLGNSYEAETSTFDIVCGNRVSDEEKMGLGTASEEETRKEPLGVGSGNTVTSEKL